MKYVATKAMRYGGRSLAPGDEFDASGRDGRLLVAIGKARLAPDAPVEADPPAKQSRAYKRRDLRAEG